MILAEAITTVVSGSAPLWQDPARLQSWLLDMAGVITIGGGAVAVALFGLLGYIWGRIQEMKSQQVINHAATAENTKQVLELAKQLPPTQPQDPDKK